MAIIFEILSQAYSELRELYLGAQIDLVEYSRKEGIVDPGAFGRRQAGQLVQLIGAQPG